MSVDRGLSQIISSREKEWTSDQRLSNFHYTFTASHYRFKQYTF